MSIQYPQEILDQQVKVKKELQKLAIMRIDYLRSIGRLPPSVAKQKPTPSDANRVASTSTSGQSKVTAS